MDIDSAITGKPAEGASATEILRADHAEVRRLFAEYASDVDEPDVRKVALRSLCLQLELHDRVEREVFYPAVRARGADGIDAFLHAHGEVMAIVLELRDLETVDPQSAAVAARLAGLVERHVRAEEDRLFPEVEKHGAAWLHELGLAIVKRKEELTGSVEDLEAPAT
jgi:hemerythrin superfamily protein